MVRSILHRIRRRPPSQNRSHIIECDRKSSIYKVKLQINLSSGHQIRRKVVINPIGPLVIHDLAPVHEALRTIMCECKAQTETVSFEEVEPASIRGIADVACGVIPQKDTCNTLGIEYRVGELEIPGVNVEFL